MRRENLGVMTISCTAVFYLTVEFPHPSLFCFQVG